MLIGCHGSVWTGQFDTAGLKLAIDGTASAGFDLIELPLMDPDKADPVAARRAAEQAGLAVTGSLGLSERTDISSEDPDVVAAGERLLGRCLEFLSEAGGTHLVGVIYCAMREYMAPATARSRQNSMDAMGRIAARGAELGVAVAVEVVNRYETYLLNTGRQGLEYVEKVGGDNLSVHLDTYHMNIEEPDMFRGPRSRRPTRLCAHRREPPRIPRFGHGRLRRVLPRAEQDRLRRADRLRVVLIGGRP